MNEKILVVDDEENILKFLATTLNRENFTVIKAFSGEEALFRMKEDPPDLVLLDIMLPGIDGYETCRKIREFSNVPIIMLTARDEDMDKITGLETGADDYLVKPFNPKELVARMKAILRRVGNAPKTVGEQKIRILNLAIDEKRRRAWLDETPLEFTPREFDLLLFLVSNPDRILTKNDILREVWGSEKQDEKIISVHMKHIRDKLGKSLSLCFQTLKKKGIKFVDISKTGKK
jgi:DNA-binding response OmpR family regulator